MGLTIKLVVSWKHWLNVRSSHDQQSQLMIRVRTGPADHLNQSEVHRTTAHHFLAGNRCQIYLSSPFQSKLLKVNRNDLPSVGNVVVSVIPVANGLDAFALGVISFIHFEPILPSDICLNSLIIRLPTNQKIGIHAAIR